MTFYEELGVPPDAALDTIRDAYRNVARLLHPDVQTDPVLKESAEAQMKRINQLYRILSDPIRRRRYDEELAEPLGRPGQLFIPPPPISPFARGHSGMLVWLAATAVCAVFIIWLATRESSSSPAVYPLPVSAGQPLTVRTPAATIPLANRPAYPQRDDELRTLRGQLLAANTDRERLARQIAAKDAERRAANLTIFTPAPLVVPVAAPEPSMPIVLPPAAVPRLEPQWSGAWIYRQAQGDKQDKTLLPPEFIEAVIAEDEGRIRGQYLARFKVADAAISPDVDFRFEGKVSGRTGHLFWTGTGGAKGDIRLHLISATSLEIVWTATDLGRSMGLASGTAVLTRKN